MMTSENKTKLIESYLNGSLSPLETILFESKLALNPGLREDLFYQKKSYQILKAYHREKQKEELETLHKKLFKDPLKRKFQQRIYHLFK